MNKETSKPRYGECLKCNSELNLYIYKAICPLCQFALDWERYNRELFTIEGFKTQKEKQDYINKLEE